VVTRTVSPYRLLRLHAGGRCRAAPARRDEARWRCPVLPRQPTKTLVDAAATRCAGGAVRPTGTAGPGTGHRARGRTGHRYRMARSYRLPARHLYERAVPVSPPYRSSVAPVRPGGTGTGPVPHPPSWPGLVPAAGTRPIWPVRPTTSLVRDRVRAARARPWPQGLPQAIRTQLHPLGRFAVEPAPRLASWVPNGGWLGTQLASWVPNHAHRKPVGCRRRAGWVAGAALVGASWVTARARVLRAGVWLGHG